MPLGRNKETEPASGVNTEHNRTASGFRTVPVIAIFYAVAGYLHLAYLQQNLDSAWLLVAVDRMLDGGDYLSDFVEVNPPWVLLVYSPAGLVARLTGAAPYTPLVLSIYLYVAVTLVLIRYVTGRFCAADSVARTWLPVAAAFFLLVYPAYDFGQRDYLACVFALPWLVLQGAVPWRERLPGRLAAGLAAWAALGLFLKPPLLLLPMLLAVFRAVRQRSFRPIFGPDMLTFGAMGLGYIVVVLIRFPDFLVVARLLVDIYGAYDVPLKIVLIKTAPFAAFAVVPAILAHFAAAGDDERRIVQVFTAAVAVAAVSVVLQHKGWWYHRLPIPVFGGVAGVLTVAMAARWIESGRSRPAVLFPAFAFLAVGAVLFCAASLQGVMAAKRTQMVQSPLYARLASLPPGAPVYAFSADVGKAFPLVPMAGAAWASRFPHLWPLAGYAWARDNDALSPGRRAEMAALVRRSVREDFTRNRPVVVLVERGGAQQGFARPFDFIEFFLADEDFAAIWSRYVFVETVGEIDVYVTMDQPA